MILAEHWEVFNWDHWEFFNWPEILREAASRQEIDPAKRPLEYWTAWCAHANAAACFIHDDK
jgi:hypothetical protein